MALIPTRRSAGCQVRWAARGLLFATLIRVVRCASPCWWHGVANMFMASVTCSSCLCNTFGILSLLPEMNNFMKSFPSPSANSLWTLSKRTLSHKNVDSLSIYTKKLFDGTLFNVQVLRSNSWQNLLGIHVLSKLNTAYKKRSCAGKTWFLAYLIY